MICIDNKGYLCQQEPVAHFGLGSLVAVDYIEITWPDGAQHTLQNPEIDRLHDVKKPKDAKIVPADKFTLDGEIRYILLMRINIQMLI